MFLSIVPIYLDMYICKLVLAASCGSRVEICFLRFCIDLCWLGMRLRIVMHDVTLAGQTARRNYEIIVTYLGKCAMIGVPLSCTAQRCVVMHDWCCASQTQISSQVGDE